VPEVERTNGSREEEIPAPSISVSKARRVLIVDDSDDTAAVMAQLARSWGHQVAVASHGLSALELASKFRPDIALIDIGLPEMNGYELARRLRQLPTMLPLQLVAITGYGREEDRRAAEEAGFNLHLVKPIDPIRLKQLLITLS
jgi:two-component system CheB/CheR fusion protein